MINIGLTPVHIGKAINEQREKKEMSKSEFARQLAIPQQHINRIFERETIDTGKLIKICQILEFNFFQLYSEIPKSINAYLAAVAFQGNAENFIWDAVLASQLETAIRDNDNKDKDIRRLEDHNKSLLENIEQLKSNLRDKDEIINLLRASK